MKTHRTEESIPVGDSFIRGMLDLIEPVKHIIIFAHGSGSSRLSPRNQFVAGELHKAGFSTFLFDLLTPQEEEIDNQTREFRFNIPLLAERLVLVTNWIQEHKKEPHLRIGYFGASTGAAAALIASAELPSKIAAIVSRGGRPDLAGDYLSKVPSPTLLLVGALDHQVIGLNKEAYKQLTCPKKIILIPGATPLFEEEGTLQEATNCAIEWFSEYLPIMHR